MNKIDKIFSDLFNINRSITGEGLRSTLGYVKKNFLPTSEIKSLKSGTVVYDWKIPPEWSIRDAYIENVDGKKIIDFQDNFLHVVSYSSPVNCVLSENELSAKLHTLPKFPDLIPYRTSYYIEDWGFCCSENLKKSDDFKGPFKVKIDSNFNFEGQLNWLECYKKGKKDDEILISTYCCHPNLANDNLSGVVAATLLFEELVKSETKYSYRLVILPETIGAISFLAKSNVSKVVGGMILTCLAGPDKLSIKEGFNNKHWINEAAHFALKSVVGEDYIRYPFVPDGSDERQYSSPGIRIVTPSIHKSKYYEYDEYHTSADNLDYISKDNLKTSLEVYKLWVKYIESYTFPKRLQSGCEYQLGKRDLYPNLGGTINQLANDKKNNCYDEYKSNSENNSLITEESIEAFQWIMHLGDGKHSNFDIARLSGLSIDLINEAILAFAEQGLVEI